MHTTKQLNYISVQLYVVFLIAWFAMIKEKEHATIAESSNAKFCAICIYYNKYNNGQLGDIPIIMSN